jgi:hypothetical protein
MALVFVLIDAIIIAACCFKRVCDIPSSSIIRNYDTPHESTGILIGCHCHLMDTSMFKFALHLLTKGNSKVCNRISHVLKDD